MAAGRLESVTQGDRESTNGYFASGSARGYLQSSTDALLRTSTYARDALGRPLTKTLPDQQVVAYGWDANGNMTSLTPPGRPAHTQGFDSIDLQQLYTPPVLPGVTTPQTQFIHDLDRQLQNVIKPDGTAVTWSYESSSGRLDALTTPAGVYDYQYYGAGTCAGCAPGRLSRIAGPAGVTLDFKYDGSLSTGSVWSGAVTGSVSYSYDGDFRVASETVTAGSSTSTVQFGYDPDSLLRCASPTGCASPGSDALTVVLDPQAPRINQVNFRNTAEVRTYNAYGELASLSGAIGSTALYSEVMDTAAEPRDQLGRIVTHTETTPTTARTREYGYDARGRLESVLEDGLEVERYTYDANGNRLTSTSALGTLSATYDNQDRLTSYGALTYTYTANGELRTKTDTTTGAVTTYTYDARGNLTRVDLPGGTVLEYIVDGLDRRVAKRRNGVIVQRWLYRDKLRIAAELDGAGNLVSRFVYATRANVPDYVIRGGATYRIFADHLGSPRVAVNVDNPGDIPLVLAHDSFGNVTQGAANAGWLPMGFAGGHYDPETGLVRFGARDYEPVAGRWTAKDPILFEGGQANLFIYVANEPVNRVDPGGLDSLDLNFSGGTGIWGGSFGVSVDLDTGEVSCSVGAGWGIGVGVSGGYTTSSGNAMSGPFIYGSAEGGYNRIGGGASAFCSGGADRDGPGCGASTTLGFGFGFGASAGVGLSIPVYNPTWFAK